MFGCADRRDAGDARAADDRQGLGARPARARAPAARALRPGRARRARRPATGWRCCRRRARSRRSPRVGPVAQAGPRGGRASWPTRGRTAVVAVTTRRGDVGRRDARAALAAARGAGPRPRRWSSSTRSSPSGSPARDAARRCGRRRRRPARHAALFAGRWAAPSARRRSRGCGESLAGRARWSRCRSCSGSALDPGGARAALAGARA